MRDKGIWKILAILMALVLIGSCAAMPSVGDVSESEVKSSSSATIYVPDDYLTIQEAVNAASAGDTIIVRDGTYTENVEVDKRLTIRSENGSDSTIVQAANLSNPTFEVSADGVNISGLTVKNPQPELPLIPIEHINKSIGGLTVKNPVGHEIPSTPPIIEYNSLQHVVDHLMKEFPRIEEPFQPTPGKERISIPIPISLGEGQGISLSGVRNVTITGNIIEDCQRGINVSSSINVTVANNTIKSSIDSIFPVNLNCYGIRLYKSNDNGVSKNNCSNNRDGGIYLDSSHNNLITSNNCSNNNFTMYFFDITTGRMEVVHYGNGISVRDSNNNIIYLNNFINNGKNVDSRGSTNLWNSTEKISYTYNGKTYTNYLGNYWDDYTGKDADGDGIGDIPYSINSDKDIHPLLKPYENYRISTFSGGNAK
ncbi:MAG: right-handed parallel beta-helix repeat-containing protein [Methanophagales archaeon]|nr:right-handed parallel beta-helix repeat-containing protein [Methanophagales archaeon]